MFLNSESYTIYARQLAVARQGPTRYYPHRQTWLTVALWAAVTRSFPGLDE